MVGQRTAVMCCQHDSRARLLHVAFHCLFQHFDKRVMKRFLASQLSYAHVSHEEEELHVPSTWG